MACWVRPHIAPAHPRGEGSDTSVVFDAPGGAISTVRSPSGTSLGHSHG